MGRKSSANPAAGRQRAAVTLAIGKRSGFTAEIDVSSGGLLAIGALVSSILFSTALVVAAARRGPADRVARDPERRRLGG